MARPYVMVPVRPDTKKRLAAAGHKGETYDQLVNRILDEHERVSAQVRVR